MRTAYADPSRPASPTHSVSPLVGVSAWTAFPECVNFMTGIRYLSSANELTDNADSGPVRRELENQYLIVPARITFRVAKPGGRQSIHVFTGAEISYWFNGKVSVFDGETGSKLLEDRVDFSSYTSRSSYINRIQYGFQAGVTWLKEQQKQQWALSVQYSHALSKHSFGDVRYASIPGFRDDYGFRSSALAVIGTFYFDRRSHKSDLPASKFHRPYWKTDL